MKLPDKAAAELVLYAIALLLGIILGNLAEWLFPAP